MRITGATRLAGVIGWPVQHSRSPLIHNYWYDIYAVNAVYVAMPIAPENLGHAVRALPHLGYVGFNVTVPHKEAITAHLDHLDDAARRMAAVNTVTVAGDGTLTGANTDGFGFIEDIKAGAPAWSPARPAVVLGAGGAARAITFALADSGVPELVILNRTQARAETLAADLRRHSRCVVEVRPWRERGQALAGAGLLVNATVLGMSGQPPLALDLGHLLPRAVVYDIVYAPVVTPLVAAARARGNPALNGLGMLLHQARPAMRLWFGIDPVVDEALRRCVSDDRSNGQSNGQANGQVRGA